MKILKNDLKYISDVRRVLRTPPGMILRPGDLGWRFQQKLTNIGRELCIVKILKSCSIYFQFRDFSWKTWIISRQID